MAEGAFYNTITVACLALSYIKPGRTETKNGFIIYQFIERSLFFIAVPAGE